MRAPLVSFYCICPSQFPLREATKLGKDYQLPKLPNSNPAFNLKPGWDLGSGLAQPDILRVTRTVREGCWRWTAAQHCCQMWVWHLLTCQPPWQKAHLPKLAKKPHLTVAPQSFQSSSTKWEAFWLQIFFLRPSQAPFSELLSGGAAHTPLLFSEQHPCCSPILFKNKTKQNAFNVLHKKMPQQLVGRQLRETRTF